MSYAKPVTKRVNVSTSKKPMISYEVKELIFEYKYVKRNEKKNVKKSEKREKCDKKKKNLIKICIFQWLSVLEWILYQEKGACWV